MLPKIVFLLVSVGLCLGQGANQQSATNQVSFYEPEDGRVRVIPRATSPVLSDPIPITNTNVDPASSTTTKSTQIDDTDYWDNDDFQPYKVDSRDFFDWRLLQAVFTQVKSNAIISPFSVKFVIALLSEAADAESNTKKELSSVFYRASSPQLLREIYHDMLESLKEPSSKYTLNIGTRMYIRNDIIPRPQYEKTLKDHYDTDIKCLNFGEAEEAASIINKWCSNITDGHLQNLVSSDNIQSAALLLVNAIYFDGKWRSPFTETFESVFFRQPTEQIRTEYMTITDKFYYFHSSMWNAKILRLPYQGKKFSMTIILPGARGGLDELIRNFEGDALRRLQWLMTEQKVKVTMPKFKFDFTAQLKETLMGLGIHEIFTESAALSGIARGSSLTRKMKVTDIIQKAGIEVHETGSTVFAATDVEIVNKFGGSTTEEFIVNRPFIFIIVDEGTSNMLFAGKVIDPTAN